jgi:hypothetical protein
VDAFPCMSVLPRHGCAATVAPVASRRLPLLFFRFDEAAAHPVKRRLVVS